MPHKIVETIIISSDELEDNVEFINYFCEKIRCPWIANGHTIRNYLKFHKTSTDSILIEFESAEWHSSSQSAGYYEMSAHSARLVEQYFLL